VWNVGSRVPTNGGRIRLVKEGTENSAEKYNALAHKWPKMDAIYAPIPDDVNENQIGTLIENLAGDASFPRA